MQPLLICVKESVKLRMVVVMVFVNKTILVKMIKTSAIRNVLINVKEHHQPKLVKINPENVLQVVLMDFSVLIAKVHVIMNVVQVANQQRVNQKQHVRVLPENVKMAVKMTYSVKFVIKLV